MRLKRLIFQNWIVDLGFDPDRGVESVEMSGSEVINEKVRSALKQIGEDEREFLARFYFMGETYKTIAEKTNREVYKLEALHNRALQALKKELGGFVEREFGIARKRVRNCPICCSPNRAAIDRLIDSKREDETWRGVIKIIRDKYRIKLGSPLVLIGHKKYH